MTRFANDDPVTETDMFAPHGDRDYPSSLLPLSNSPFYLPNLIAAIVAALGIVAGGIGPWASVSALNLAGIDVQTWGVVALIIGGAAAGALFVQLNWGRTNFSLRWAVPMVWAAMVAGVSCLAISVVKIVTILAVRDQLGSDLVVIQVGWGLWLVAFCSAVLCITAPVVAGQVSKAAQREPSPVPAAWLGGWRWAGVVASGVVLLIALATAYKPIVDSDDSGGAQVATRTVVAPTQTITADRPTQQPASWPNETVPASAMPCPSNFSNVEFSTSARGTDITSCPFAEAIRYRYVNQSVRNGVVELNVTSPVTGQNYTMTCRGGEVVRCVGGNNAEAYLY